MSTLDRTKNKALNNTLIDNSQIFKNRRNNSVTNIHKNSLPQQANNVYLDMRLSIQYETKGNFGSQAGISDLAELSAMELPDFNYQGKRITDLSVDEAKQLISDNGHFGSVNTAQRVAEFALSRAGTDAERLHAAKDAMLKGFKEAEQVFDGSLPEISYRTIEKAFEIIDDRILFHGGSL